MRLAVVGIVMVLLVVGCMKATSPVSQAPVQIVESSSPPKAKNPQRQYLVSEWAKSEDEALSLRITVSVGPEEAKAVHVIAFLVNNGSTPVTVLRPFGDAHEAAASGFEIRRDKARCEYQGPIPTYTLGEAAFATLEPGGTIADSLTVLRENYRSFDADGDYRLSFTYAVSDHRRDTAKRLQQPEPWMGRITTLPVIITIGDASPPNQFEQHVAIRFTRPHYKFTLAEAAAGVRLEYDIAVDRDFSGVIAFSQLAGGGQNHDPNELLPFEQISGEGQSYAIRDVGLGPPPKHQPLPLAKGTYRHVIEWDGRNWNGPSDTSNPKGEPFPPGTYTLRVTALGNVDTPEGRRHYAIENSVPVIIAP